MTDSIGDRAIGGTAESASTDCVHTLADVLDYEFEQLHPTKKEGTPDQKRVAAGEAKQPPQPLEDPSLSPAADQQTNGQSIAHPQTGETPSGHADDNPEARKLRSLWEKVHALKG